MSVISKKFAKELSHKEMRDAFLDAQTRTKLAQQIRTLRVQRELSQEALGELMGGKPQGNIARLEDRDVGRYTLTTLLELASAFDVGFVAKFVPYENFLRDTGNLSRDALKVRSFNQAALVELYDDSQVGTEFPNWITFTGPTVNPPALYDYIRGGTEFLNWITFTGPTVNPPALYDYIRGGTEFLNCMAPVYPLSAAPIGMGAGGATISQPFSGLTAIHGLAYAPPVVRPSPQDEEISRLRRENETLKNERNSVLVKYETLREQVALQNAYGGSRLNDMRVPPADMISKLNRPEYT